MRFLVDAQLPPALSRRIAELGFAAEHVADCSLQSATDRQIWEHATVSGAVIVTKDEDFSQRRSVVDFGPAIVWVRLPNSRRKDLLAWFEAALPDIVEALNRGETVIEVI